jgi:malate/lactate dehydrogenase
MPKGSSKNRLVIQDVKELSIKNERIEQISLKALESAVDVSEFIKNKINDEKVVMINPSYGLEFNAKMSRKKSVTILGLGDVGGTLLLGLRLLGKDVINEIRLFDLNEDKIKRYILEMNQIVYPNDCDLPKVVSATMGDLFDTDVFIFTASKFVPKVGDEKKDVRMIQYEANKEIIKIYAKMARKNNFKGLFAVVSDPVDLLCNVVFYESNKNEDNILDYKGLLPNQVRGFGLGVMNGRANYYSEIRGLNYKDDGRVFGPHGKGLIVANSLKNYSDDISLRLTEDVITANLKVRETGFKPYIAPALSSGALSILETLRGNYNYSTVFINGIYWGIRNRLINGSIGIERRNLNDALMIRIKASYDELRRQYEKN